MELEAENWYLDSTSHDFDDKKNHQKILFFSCRKILSPKIVQLFQKYFQNWKFSLKSQSKKFGKSQHFLRKISTFFKISGLARWLKTILGNNCWDPLNSQKPRKPLVKQRFASFRIIEGITPQIPYKTRRLCRLLRLLSRQRSKTDWKSIMFIRFPWGHSPVLKTL